MRALSELLSEFELFWPSSHADDWDRVGLLAGSESSEVRNILVSVDLTDAVIDEAIHKNVQLIVTHHPLLLKPITSVAEDKLKGSLITRLIRNNIAVFSAHTNADTQVDGASSLMAQKFGLVELVPLSATNAGFGHGVIGLLPQPMRLKEFAEMVSSRLPRVARKVAFAGQPDAAIQKVAICSGAGDSFIPLVLESDVDVYVTSDLRHHPTQDAISTPRKSGTLNLIDVSHWAAESLWVESAIRRIDTLGEVVAIASTVNTDPWTQEVN